MRQVKLQKKINSATNKAKELGILNDKPKVKLSRKLNKPLV